MVGKNIKKFRQSQNMSQEELAERLNVTRQAISNWETGKTQPDIDTLHNISMILGVTIEELIYGTERKTVITKTVINKEHTGDAAKKGLSFGAALAMVISYVQWRSIGWAIVHGILGWVYVIYYVLKYVLPD